MSKEVRRLVLNSVWLDQLLGVGQFQSPKGLLDLRRHRWKIVQTLVYQKEVIGLTRRRRYDGDRLPQLVHPLQLAIARVAQ